MKTKDVIPSFVQNKTAWLLSSHAATDQNLCCGNPAVQAAWTRSFASPPYDGFAFISGFTALGGPYCETYRYRSLWGFVLLDIHV